MCSEEFLITRNDHHRNVLAVLQRYLDEETLVDCTIAAEGESLKAHRLVLSACSTYFELLFGQEVKKERVVALEDIKFKDLKSLVAFMYEGQVTIHKDRLLDFIRGAEFLQIRGLPSDLVQKSQRAVTETSVVCRKEGLASQLYNAHMKSFTHDGESSDGQSASSVSRNQTGDEKPSTYMQKGSLKEKVFLQPESNLESDSNRETAVISAEKEPPLEPKGEIDVEDTPIWESDDENTSAVTDVTSATASENVQSGLTAVQGTVRSRRGFVSSPRILEKETETSARKYSSVTAADPSSMNIARSSPLVSKVPTEQYCAMEDSSSCVVIGVTEQSVCVKNKPVVNTDVIPTVLSSHSESRVEPMHEVWVQEVRSWDCDEVITESDLCRTSNRRIMRTDEDDAAATAAAAPAPDNNQCAVKPNVVLKDFVSSCVVAQRDKINVDVEEVKEEKEVDEWCIGQECESIDVNDSTVDKVVESGLNSVIEIDGNAVKEEHVMEGQEMIEQTSERAVEADVVGVQSETEEEDLAMLSERISKKRKKSYKCFRCQDIYTTVTELQLHVRNVHDKRHCNRCQECKITFVSRSKLLTHMRRHTGERPFKCYNCKRSFSHKGSLIVHMRTHTGDRPFRCELCDMSFTQLCNLTKHKRIHSADRPFKCDYCVKAFNTKDSVKKHLRTHTGERPYKCDVCGRPFSDRGNLTKHKQIHIVERPFQCEACKKTFSVKEKLTVHQRIHTGERPFKCKVCEKSFSERSSLSRHKHTHARERSLQCEVCEKSFRDSSTLAKHKQTHIGKRRFVCEVCEISFNFECNLTRHKRTHTG